MFRVGLGDFAISSFPVGLGFSKNQGGVAISRVGLKVLSPFYKHEIVVSVHQFIE